MGHGRPTDRRPRKFMERQDGGDQGPGGSTDHLDSPGGCRSFQRAMWTGSRDPFGQRGGSREPRGQPGKQQWAAREAPASYLDCLGGSRDRPSVSPGGCRWSTRAIGRPGRLQRAIWTARETAETDLDSPGGSRRGLGPLNLCIGRLSGRQLKGLGPLNLG